MTSSVLLTNTLFCGFAALLLIPLLKDPKALIYKNGIPIYIIMGIIFLKMLIPYEFSFTHTLASKNVLPVFKELFKIQVFEGITVESIFLLIWVAVSLLLFLYLVLNQWRLKKILSIVPVTKNAEINDISSELCTQKKVQKQLRIIQIDITASPFIMGFHFPIIVLPTILSKEEAKFVLMHELEHLIHNHILIKSIIDLIAVIYWWNPIIWLLRRELLCALELQADIKVTQNLSGKESLDYLETLVNVSRKGLSKTDTRLSLSFALKNSLIGYRVSTILSSNYLQKKKITSILDICLLISSIALLLFSTGYTFEAYYPFPDTEGNVFTIDATTDYFMLREESLYDLYVDGDYAITFDHIPEDFSNLPVHK